MTSLTFFSMFKQFYAIFINCLNALYLQCNLSTYATLTWAQVSTNTTSTALRNVLMLHHQIGVRGALLADSHSAPTPYEGQNYTISDKVTPLWKCICEPPEIQIGGYRGDSRSTASLGLITRFMLIAYNRRGLCQRCTGAGVSEWPPAGVLTNFENRSGAGVVFWIWG